MTAPHRGNYVRKDMAILDEAPAQFTIPQQIARE